MKNKWLRYGLGIGIFLVPLLFQAHLGWLILTGLIGLNIALTGSLIPCPMCSTMNLVQFARGKAIFCEKDRQ